jgi:hypothetical protein
MAGLYDKTARAKHVPNENVDGRKFSVGNGICFRKSLNLFSLLSIIVLVIQLAEVDFSSTANLDRSNPEPTYLVLDDKMFC